MSENESPKEIVVEDALVIANPWRALRQHTPARIGLGRAGHSLPTREHLEFQLAHARARDAVYYEFDSQPLVSELTKQGFETLQVHSRAENRLIYLQQPDMGRRLNQESCELLQNYKDNNPHPYPQAGFSLRKGEENQAQIAGYNYEAVFVLADGLSAQAVLRNALPLFNLVSGELLQKSWRVAPVVIANQSRVALGDEIGELLRAEQVAIFIGERPGLSAPDSLGVYLTYNPEVGRLESDRNCISNIRPEGLSYQEAADTLLYLMREARQRKTSGVALKDERDLSP